MPVVLNKTIHGNPKGAVYVGRPSKWGNPYLIGRDGDREAVVHKYTMYLLQSPLLHDLHELRGHDLLCWCAPQACHADVLFILANCGDDPCSAPTAAGPDK